MPEALEKLYFFLARELLPKCPVRRYVDAKHYCCRRNPYQNCQQHRMLLMSQKERDLLRKKILACRDRLTTEERHQKSRAIANNLWKIEHFSRAKTIFVYVNFKSEVETLALIRQCLAQKIQISVPLTVPEKARLIPYVIHDPELDLRPGYCAIPEPVPERLETIPPRDIEVVILPGSVFDIHGGRLGYGGGYYDRFLEQEAPQALRIGFAYECQVVEALPLLPHDQRLHYLVTEERIVKMNDPV